MKLTIRDLLMKLKRKGVDISYVGRKVEIKKEDFKLIAFVNENKLKVKHLTYTGSVFALEILDMLDDYIN